MRTICKILSGSRLYGLETENSDHDYVGVFLNESFSEILGLDRFDYTLNLKNEEKNEEECFFELRHFLELLRNTNTRVLELLFAKQFLILTKEFKSIQKQKYQLISSEKLFYSLSGYIHSEKKLATGERTGKLGSIRKKQIDEHGFSPKNFSHLLRLCYCGITFFKTNKYPLNIKENDSKFHELIFSIKTNPKKYSKNDLLDLSEKYIEELNKSFENRINNYNFDRDVANEICFKIYMPILRKVKNVRNKS